MGKGQPATNLFLWLARMDRSPGSVVFIAFEHRAFRLETAEACSALGRGWPQASSGPGLQGLGSRVEVMMRVLRPPSRCDATGIGKRQNKKSLTEPLFYQLVLARWVDQAGCHCSQGSWSRKPRMNRSTKRARPSRQAPSTSSHGFGIYKELTVANLLWRHYKKI